MILTKMCKTYMRKHLTLWKNKTRFEKWKKAALILEQDDSTL